MMMMIDIRSPLVVAPSYHLAATVAQVRFDGRDVSEDDADHCGSGTLPSPVAPKMSVVEVISQHSCAINGALEQSIVETAGCELLPNRLQVLTVSECFDKLLNC